MKHPAHRRSAFTLVELVIAIAIIMVLAAILFPAFAKAREESRKASCASNLKQLAAALKLYVDDWRSLPVMCADPTNNPSNYTTMNVALSSYTKNDDVFRCRSDASYWQTHGKSSYGWVEFFNGQRMPKPSYSGIDLTKVPCLGDAQSWHAVGGPKGGKNVLYVDGSVQFAITP